MKFIAAVCLSIFIINTGLYGIYQIMIFHAKWNASVLIRNGDNADRMQILKLSNKDAQVFDQDEVMYRGVMFDVAKKITGRDSVILYLYPDHDEQNALTQLVNYFKSDETSLVAAGEKLFRIKSLQAAQDQISQHLIHYKILNSDVISVLHFSQAIPGIANIFQRVPTPPPEHFPL
jgi:hypothetical protein